jgi:hypothetical protein
MTQGPDTHQTSLQAAWAALWTTKSAYDLPALLTRQIVARGQELSPLTTLELPATGSIKLLQNDQWGTVALELDDIVVTGVPALQGGQIYVHGTGITAELQFGGLTIGGTYRVSTGGPGSPAALTMVDSVARKYGAMRSAAAALGDSTDQGLANATANRATLAQTPNGRQMVGTYYDNNDAFNHIMSQPVMSYLWTTTTTPDSGGTPQPTAFYANQATAATAPSATIPVNGAPDNQGNSPFNMHSFTMSTYVISQGLSLYCTYSDPQNAQYDPAKAAQVLAAVNATLGFETNTKPPSTTSQTAGDVIALVQSGTPQPGPPPQPQCNTNAAAAHAEWLGAAWSNEPAWLQETRAKARANFHALDAHTKAGGTLGSQMPAMHLRGTFSAPLGPFSATLSGTISASQDASTARFTTLTAKLPPPTLTLDGPTSALLTASQTAVGQAAFLRGVLRQRVLQQLQQGGLLSHLNTVLYFAATGALG